MKLDSYLMLCAMKAGDYITAGNIMAQHFDIPEIARITSTLSPAIGFLNPKHGLQHLACVACHNISYYWYNTIGFIGPRQTVARPQHYQTFDIWVLA